VSPVNTVAEALDAPPGRERKLITNMLHPKLGTVPQITSPIFSGNTETVGYDDRASMTVCELKELGYEDREIAALQHEKVILAQ
jgi:crotonobetainyl-CoA:carnitine CoA-transferase CaiB-like acyl-CoA transferase